MAKAPQMNPKTKKVGIKMPPRMWWWVGAGAILMSSVAFGASVAAGLGGSVLSSGFFTSGFCVFGGFVVDEVVNISGAFVTAFSVVDVVCGAFAVGSVLSTCVVVAVAELSGVDTVSFFLTQYSFPLLYSSFTVKLELQTQKLAVVPLSTHWVGYEVLINF